MINHLTLDGVMQSPGRPEEDTRCGFAHGGWGARSSDQEALAAVYGRVEESGGLRLLLGRWTYEEMLGYWNGRDSPFTEGLNNAPKYVASRTLREPLRWPNSTLLQGEAGVAVAGLKQEMDGDLFIMGSGDLIDTLRRHELIDEYLLVVHPLVLGTGRRMFADGTPPAHLRLVSSTSTGKGVVIARYRTVS